VIDTAEILAANGDIETVLRPAGPDLAVLDLRHSALVFIERRPRARCARCRLRRVLYRIAVRSIAHSPEFTEARCATCWGITALDED
jgi:hypothetical protein